MKKTKHPPKNITVITKHKPDSKKMKQAIELLLNEKLSHKSNKVM